MNKHLFFACAILSMMPFTSHAAVLINEVAWMGNAVSATDEWIELENDGPDAISLSGWKLVADDGDPSITLAGSIEAGGYYILERTDDNTVASTTADLIYTGNLGNTGETLKLIDGSGATVDTVAGGTDWATIGGNNTTKDTPQRQPDGTWLTGVPTPKSQNTATASPVLDADGPKVKGASKSKKTTGGYKQIVFAYAGEDMMGIADAHIAFEGYAVDDKNTRLSAPSYEWSFGDGSKDKGKEVSHAYFEPGVYTVALTVRSDYQKSKDKAIVTILPANVHVRDIKAGEGGFVEIENASDAELDLGNWRVAVHHVRGKTKDGLFIVPENTFVAPRMSVRFSAHVTDLVIGDDDMVFIQFPSGKRVKEPASETGTTTAKR